MSKRILLPALALLVLFPIAAPAQETPTPRERQMLHRLETTRVTMDFRETPIEDVVDYLRLVTEVDIVIDPKALADLDDAARRVTLKVRDLSASNALRLILAGAKLDYTIKNGVLLVTGPESARGGAYTKIYDIRDLLFEVRDFPGPDISLADAKGDGGHLGVIFEDTQDDGQDITQPEVVMEIVRENVAPESWDREDVGLKVVGGHLVVRQTREIHAEVSRMLDMLRAYK